MPIIRLPHPLESHAGGERDVRVEGRDVNAALADLIRRFPALKPHIFDSYSNEPHNFINLFVNDEDIRFMAGLNTRVAADDLILLLPVVAGG